jgi:hypothetical protein
VVLVRALLVRTALAVVGVFPAFELQALPVVPELYVYVRL